MTTVRIMIVWTVLFCLAAACLAGCATPAKPVSCPLPDRELTTLQSPVSLSVRSGGSSFGGRGYLMYQRPDRFHLAILAPFGMTLLDLFVKGERITCIIPSKETAYTGLASDLPRDNALKSWGLLSWIADRPKADPPFPDRRVCRTADGRRETIVYDLYGRVTSKESADGDKVHYADYLDINGIAIPKSMELTNRLGDLVKISFEEPEINLLLDDAALTPMLDGLTVLPLASFQGP